MLTLLHHLYPKPVILFKCGRIRFDWLKAQIIVVWLLCLSLLCAYCLFSITWPFNLVIQKSRLTSLLACCKPEIQEFYSCNSNGLHLRSIWSPTLMLAATNRWYLRQKLWRKYLFMCLILKFHPGGHRRSVYNPGHRVESRESLFALQSYKETAEFPEVSEHAGYAQQFRKLGYKLPSFL